MPCMHVHLGAELYVHYLHTVSFASARVQSRFLELPSCCSTGKQAMTGRRGLQSMMRLQVRLPLFNSCADLCAQEDLPSCMVLLAAQVCVLRQDVVAHHHLVPAAHRAATAARKHSVEQLLPYTSLAHTNSGLYAIAGMHALCY